MLSFRRVLRQEHEAGSILADFGEFETDTLALFLEKEMGHLQENPRAVAGIGFATAGAAMVQVPQHLQRLLNDLVGFRSLDVHHESNAAGIVFKPGIVKALPGGQAVGCRARVFH